MLRTMKNSFMEKVFYQSTFDTQTGALTRICWRSDRKNKNCGSLVSTLFANQEVDSEKVLVSSRWEKKFGSRRRAFSPVPEVLDISITDSCSFGCSYCYQNSKKGGLHAPADLIERVLKDFDQPPYQLAIGGGEPTEHPNLPDMLLKAAELGSVPNYCTNGIKFDSKMEALVEATNKACGSVAVTFHGDNLVDWGKFIEIYSNVAKVLSVPLNIHLIVDRDAVRKLEFLLKKQDVLGKLRVLLLAYYPDVGRASIGRLIPKRDYQELFPEVLKRSLDSGMQIGFSEGLLPYFISRPEIGITTEFMTRSSGLFSAYVDRFGRMSVSSFDPPPKEDEPCGDWLLDSKNPEKRWAEVLTACPAAGSGKKILQKLWNHLDYWWGSPSGPPCYDCLFEGDCIAPDPNHAFICAFMPHNGKDPVLSDKSLKSRRVMEAVLAVSDFTKDFKKTHGREPTNEEMNSLISDVHDAFKL